MDMRRSLTIVAATTSAAIATALTVPQLASASGEHGAAGVTATPESNVSLGGPVEIGVSGDDIRLITTRIVVEPGGETPWHFHPGPHFVSVKEGKAVVFNKDCSVRGTFLAGTGFFDRGWASPKPRKAVHTLRNPSRTERTELIVTDVRTGGKPPTIPVAPQPATCR